MIELAEFFNNSNAWVKSHFELISLIGIPLLTFFVTRIASAAAEKRSSKDREVERKLAVELKLVEFRQKWIDDLRDDFAAFMSAAGAPEAEGSATTGMSALARINLRINPQDPDFSKLIDGLHGLSIMIHKVKDQKSIQAFGLANADLIDIAQRILKREWDRLKDDLRAARI